MAAIRYKQQSVQGCSMLDALSQAHAGVDGGHI